MDDHRTTGRPPTDGTDHQFGANNGNSQSLGDIVTSVIEDIQNIVRGEVQLAKTEIKEDAGKIGKAAGMLVGAAFLALVGFIFLMLGVTYLLNKSLEMWISAGIVGVALLIIGGIFGMIGKNHIQEASMVPDKTIESLKEDKEWASRQINSVKK